MNSSGHPFGPGPTATIREDSPRANAWRTIFGGLTAPIKTAVPQRCEIARTVSLVYWLDIGRIDSEMMDRLVAHAQSQIAGAVPHEQVRIVLVAEGMPIKYEDVSTITDEHPEGIIAGLDAEIAKATGVAQPSRYARETEEYDRAFDAKNHIITARVPNLQTVPSVSGISLFDAADRLLIRGHIDERTSDAQHRVLDAVMNDITDRMDAQAGIPDISSELSSGDGLPPALCPCLTDNVSRGPFCARVYAKETMIKGADGVNRRRKHGGAPQCPRRCVECPDGAHHFCEIDRQPVFDLEHDLEDDDADDLEEKELLRKHPAHLAGCESWYECRHCDAWMEASDDDDVDLDDDDVSLNSDNDSPMNKCDDCGEDYADCDCDPDSDDFDFDDEDDEDDDEPDRGPPSSLSMLRAMNAVLAEHPTNDAENAFFVNQQDVQSVALDDRDSLAIAGSIMFAARFMKLISVRIPNSLTLAWAGVIAQWPVDVLAEVQAWLELTADEEGLARMPTAVRALIDQAKANGGES